MVFEKMRVLTLIPGLWIAASCHCLASAGQLTIHAMLKSLMVAAARGETEDEWLSQSKVDARETTLAELLRLMVQSSFHDSAVEEALPKVVASVLMQPHPLRQTKSRRRRARWSFAHAAVADAKHLAYRLACPKRERERRGSSSSMIASGVTWDL